MTTAENEALRQTVRALLDRHASGPGPAPDAAPGGYDARLWTLLAGQVGIAGLAVPEDLGGAGYGYPECHLVLEELGRAAAATPFLATGVLATQALLAARTKDVLPELAAGTATAALGWGDGVEATRGGDGWRIDGELAQVIDGARADIVLVLAGTGAGPALFRLGPEARRDTLPTMDQTLHLARLTCTGTPAELIGAVGTDVPRRIDDLAVTAITAEQVGGAERCLAETVSYVGTRVQFGRPIGSFQAVKHRLADLFVLVESARSASLAAVDAWAADAPGAGLAASLAKSYCSEVYRAAAAEMIQLHGGIGFTWEHPAHRHFKRAHATAVLFGDPAYHRRRIATALGLPG